VPDAASNPGTGTPEVIGYLSPSGWGNLGDEAIQEAAVAALRARWPGGRLRAFTLNPSATARRHQVEAEPISGVSTRYNYIRFEEVPRFLERLDALVERVQRPWILHRLLRWLERPVRLVVLETHSLVRAWDWLGTADLLLAAGGGQLDDSWGGAAGHPYSLARWAWLARRRRVPFALLSVGFGQARGWLSRSLLRYAANTSAYCSLRDEGSRRLTTELGVRSPLTVVPDLAFALSREPGEPPSAPPLHVGLSPMAFHHSRWPEADAARYERHVGLWTAVVAARVARGDRVHLYTTNPTDDAVVEEIWARLDAAARAGCERAPVTTVPGLLSLYARLHVVVATRLHAVLLGLVAERPTVALSYERKVQTLMREAELSPYCLELENAEPKAVSAAIDAAAEHRQAITAQIGRRVAGWRDQVEQQFRLLPSLVGAGA